MLTVKKVLKIGQYLMKLKGVQKVCQIFGLTLYIVDCCTCGYLCFIF